MRKFFLAVIVISLIIFNSKISAQFNYGFSFNKAGSAGLQFLKIGVGARETGMGEAVSGTIKDADAVFWNVAGLAYVDHNEVNVSYDQWLIESRHSAAVAAFPFNSFVVAVSAVSLLIKDFEETTAQQPDGTGRMVSAGDILVGLAVARRFTDKLSIGVQLKYVNEKLDNYSIGNVLFDVGTIYNTGFHDLHLGFSLQHYGPDMKIVNQVYRTPLLFRLSAGDNIINTNDFKLLTEVDLIHPTDNNEWVNCGVEGTFLNMISLRAGYRFNRDLGNVSFGVGVVPPSFGFLKVKVDYSFVPYGNIFGDIHRISLGLSF